MLSEFMSKKLTKYFHLRDLDQDGFVEQEDWERSARNLAEIRGWKPGSPEYADIVAKHVKIWAAFWKPADQDNDGKVALDEYLTLTDTLHKGGSFALNVILDLFGAIFDIIDRDADGQITFQDYALYFKAWGLEEDLAQQAFSQIDLSGDGSVSRSSFVQFSSNFFMSDEPNLPGSQLFGPYEQNTGV
jgi:Ca2+-binding EF-hand superfamily protein